MKEEGRTEIRNQNRAERDRLSRSDNSVAGRREARSKRRGRIRLRGFAGYGVTRKEGEIGECKKHRSWTGAGGRGGRASQGDWNPGCVRSQAAVSAMPRRSWSILSTATMRHRHATFCRGRDKRWEGLAGGSVAGGFFHRRVELVPIFDAGRKPHRMRRMSLRKSASCDSNCCASLSEGAAKSPG